MGGLLEEMLQKLLEIVSEDENMCDINFFTVQVFLQWAHITFTLKNTIDIKNK